MKALVIKGIEDVDVKEIPMPEVGKDEVLIKIKACALCTYEQRAYVGEKKAKFPFLGGHEISGVVEKIGANVDPDEFPIGQKVSGRTQVACGTCYHCRRGEYELCEHLSDYRYNGPDCYGFGGTAEYIALNKSQVFPYHGDLSFEEMALTEPVACVLNSVAIADPKLGDDALVIGGGIMGQLHLMLLKARGCRTILSEPDEERRKFALARGVDICIDPTSEDLHQRIKELTSGNGVETLINTTAIPSVEQDAISLVANRGTLVTYSSQHPDSPVSFSPNWLHNSEARLTGSVNPSIKSFNQAVEVLSKGIIKVDGLVSKVFTMDEGKEAFEAALKKDTYRVVIRI